MFKKTARLTAAMAAVALTTSAGATPLLNVDFGAAGAEPGFVEQSSTNQTHATTAGDVTIDLAGVQGIFNFATTGTNDLLYRDFYFKNSGTITLTINGPGIAPNTDYDLTFWSYYGALGRNTTFNPTSGTTGPSLGPISLSNSPAPSALFDPLYSISGTYTSDGSGILTILVGGTGNRPAINALEIGGGAPALPGDTDGDGDIDDTDLGTSFSNYTGPVGGAGGKTAAQGDTDGDGDVDDSDLGTSFSGYTGPLGPSAVPEPTSLAPIGLGGLLIARRRRD